MNRFIQKKLTVVLLFLLIAIFLFLWPAWDDLAELMSSPAEFLVGILIFSIGPWVLFVVTYFMISDFKVLRFYFYFSVSFILVTIGFYKYFLGLSSYDGLFELFLLGALWILWAVVSGGILIWQSAVAILSKNTKT